MQTTILSLVTQQKNAIRYCEIISSFKKICYITMSRLSFIVCYGLFYLSTYIFVKVIVAALLCWYKIKVNLILTELHSMNSKQHLKETRKYNKTINVLFVLYGHRISCTARIKQNP